MERHHLDTNRHVNNAQYVAIARELLPVDFALGELRVEYRKAAVLGDVMYPKLAQVPEGYVGIAAGCGRSGVCEFVAGKDWFVKSLYVAVKKLNHCSRRKIRRGLSASE